MRGDATVICDAMDEFAAQHDFLINIGPDKGRKVAKMIADKKPSVVVELGGYVGYSALLFGKALKDAHQGNTQQTSPPTLWSLEADPIFASITMNLVDLAGLSNIVKVVTGPAADSLTRLKQENKLTAIDMLFLDHVEELYHIDLKKAEDLRLFSKDSILVADNVLRPGAPEYRKYVRQHANLETYVIEGLIVPGDMPDELDISTFIN